MWFVDGIAAFIRTSGAGDLVQRAYRVLCGGGDGDDGVALRLLARKIGEPPAMSLALKVVALVLVTTYMLQVGLATRHGALLAGARRKRELARAVFLMLVLGPLLARGLAWVVALDARGTVALVLLSLAGVVPLASKSARAVRGDVPLAVVVTFVLGALTAFTAAPTTRLLLGYAGPLEVRTGSLLLQVALLQGIPLAAGLALRRALRPGHARGLERVLRWLNVAATVLVLGVVVVILVRAQAIRSLGWPAGLAAVGFSLLLAALGHALGGPDDAGRRTLTALVNMPNVALALLIVTSAGVDPGFSVAVAGMFFLRFVVGVGIQRLLARSSARAEHVSGAGAAS